MSARSHQEMDKTNLLGEERHKVYQRLIGILHWLCCIGRTDIMFAVCSLSCFSAFPRKKQLRAVEQVFQYLKDFLDQEIIIDHCNLEGVLVIPVPDTNFEQQYPDAFEEIDPNIPQAFGPPYKYQSSSILIWDTT